MDDPFDPGQASPFADGAVAPSDPFAALGLEPDPDDGYEVEDAPLPAPANPLEAPADDDRGAFGYQAETRVHEVDEDLRRKASGDDEKSGGRLQLPAKIGAVVLRTAWVLVQAILLAGFLTLAIVYARGGNAADVMEGRATDVVLGRIAAAGEAGAPLRAVEVSVSRRAAATGESVVVVSGNVVNEGDADAPAVRVEVSFGDGPAFQGWAGTEMSGLDLAAASSEEQLLELVARTPKDAAVPVGSPRRFYVIARAVEDGLKASVSVEVAEPPPPPAPRPAVEDAKIGAAEEPPPKKKRLRKRRATGDTTTPTTPTTPTTASPKLRLSPPAGG